jgi:hypothetical protein
MTGPYAIRTPDALVSAACALAGSDDFGGDDYRAGLEALVDSVNGDVALTQNGMTIVEDKIISLLANRLRVEVWLADHPAASGDEVQSITLVVGLPRTGTTALVGMLAQDQGFRSLRSWEAADPCPPPDAAHEESDPRLIAAKAAAASIPPEVAAMHIFDPTGPEEDHDLMGLSFRSGAFGGLWPAHRYQQWWLDADPDPAFAYHERVLRLLGSRRPPNSWLLKQPLHLFALEAFARRYPQAKFVMTHRDPAKALPSVCSLMTWSYSSVTDGIDPIAHGRFQLGFWAEGMRRALVARDRLGPERFVDVHHSDLVTDPMGQIERIYAFLGRQPDSAARETIAQYISSHASDGGGRHRYVAADYGLDGEQIRDVFSDYIQCFDL